MADWGGRRAGSGRKPKPVRTTKAKPAPSSQKPAAEPKHRGVTDPRELAHRLRQATAERVSRTGVSRNPFVLPAFPPSAVPPKERTMAMDNALVTNLNFAANQWAAGGMLNDVIAEGLSFMGYPYLAELAQRPEYRTFAETIADDATRKWIDFDVTGDEDENRRRAERDPVGEAERMEDPDEKRKRVDAAGKTDKVKALKDDQERLQVRDRFYEIARDDGLMGRSHLYLNFGEAIDGDPVELASPIGDGRDAISTSKIAEGSFKRLQNVEAMWCYPMGYNAQNPLSEAWYNPQQWYVQGREIHRSRLPMFVGRPVPDMLKPAYAFGGLSITQMAQPYVDIWLTTRQSVADLVHAFSVMVLLTDLSSKTAPGTINADVMNRVDLFTAFRDNRGLFVLDKTREDFKNVSVSIAGLHELQAQAQEHMASVSRIPLVKLTGISPSGLNASSEGEIQVYDDTIGAFQNRVLQPNLVRVINFEQLSLWGEIDPEITMHFRPLRELTEKERAEKQKQDADRHQTYVDMGALAPGEVRKVIINDPELPYTDLDPEDVPDLEEEEVGGLEPEGGRPQPQAGNPNEAGEGDDA